MREIRLKKNELDCILTIAKMYGVKIYGDRKSGFSGWYTGTNEIIIGMQARNKEQIFNNFFHELQHYINYRTGKFKIYHNSINLSKRLKTKKNAINYSLRADCYTDLKAKQLMKVWFPTMKYDIAYKNTKRHKKLAEKWFSGFL